MKLKLLVVLFLALGSWFLVSQKAYAQTASPSANYFNTEANVPVNLHTYTQSIFIDLASTVSCILSGVDPLNPTAKCLGMNPITQKIGYTDSGGGLTGVLGNLIAGTFYLPLNTHQYMDYVASNFGFTKQTYAQEAGLGFNALLPTLTMWKAFRNITYMIFTLVFIVIGVGIMFRIKLDPRTVMGLQNTIPKIILALIFITFSYAIAGFLVDMMYVSVYVIISIFAQQGFDTSSAVASTPFDAIGRLGGMHDIAYGVSSSMSGIISDFFSGTIGNIVGGAIGVLIGKLTGGGIGGLFGQTGSAIGSAVGVITGGIIGGVFGTKTVGLFAGIITYLIVMIAMVSALFRLWFMLIKCYLYVFLTTVFAPFYILMGVLPGQSGIGGWFKGMLANLIAFPATVVMFLLGKAFISAFQVPQGELVRPFTPPLIGDFTSPDKMSAIIGLGIILLTPEIVNMVKEALKVKDLSAGSAIGRSLGAGAGVLGAPIKGFTGGMFGHNKDGTSKPGSQWLGEKFGAIGTMISGGIPHAGQRMVRNPLTGSPINPLRGVRLANTRRQRAQQGRGAAPAAPWTPHNNQFYTSGPNRGQLIPPGGQNGNNGGNGGNNNGGNGGDDTPPAAPAAPNPPINPSNPPDGAGGGITTSGPGPTTPQGPTVTTTAGGETSSKTITARHEHEAPSSEDIEKLKNSPNLNSYNSGLDDEAMRANYGEGKELPHKETPEQGEQEEQNKQETQEKSGSNAQKEYRTEEEVLTRLNELARLQRDEKGDNKKLEREMMDLNETLKKLRGRS